MFADKRHPAYPDVPTAKELGVTTSVPPGHNGLFAPKGLPAEVKSALERGCANAVKSEAVLRVIGNTGQTIVYLDSAQFEAQTRADYKFKGELIKRLGLATRSSYSAAVRVASGMRRLRRGIRADAGVRRLAIGLRDAEDHRLVERVAGDLHGERQAVLAAAGRHRDRRRAGDVEHQPALLVVGLRDRRRIVDPAGQQQARQRDHRVEIAHRLGELAAQRRAQLLRLDVFRRRHERAGQDAVAGQRAKVLRPRPGCRARGSRRPRPRGWCGCSRSTAAAATAGSSSPGAELSQHVDRGCDRAHLLGIGRGILGVEMLDHADAQALQAGLQVLQAVAGARASCWSDRPDRGRRWRERRSRCPRPCASSARRGRANGSAGTRR